MVSSAMDFKISVNACIPPGSSRSTSANLSWQSDWKSDQSALFSRQLGSLCFRAGPLLVITIGKWSLPQRSFQTLHENSSRRSGCTIVRSIAE
jgi:hypothetical protein